MNTILIVYFKLRNLHTLYRKKQLRSQIVMKKVSKKETEIKSHGPKNLIAV